MEVGPPEKIVRRPVQNPPPPQWHNNSVAQNNPPPHPPPLSSRNLPPPPSHPPPHTYGPSPFSRPDASLPPIDTADRRHPGHNERPSYESPDSRRPLSGPLHGYQPPPSGPPHPQSSPYSGQRDTSQRNPMIKRDPSAPAPDETQYRRSPSNHSDHNVNQHAAHDGSRGPYQLPHQHQQPLPYDPSHQQRNNSYPPPPSPMGAPNQFPTEPYARAVNFPHHEPYPSVNYPQQQGTPRNDTKPRKPQRAAQACDSCRTLKAKCDEGRPKCNSCIEKGGVCNYRDPPPKQQDKSNVDLTETLSRIESIMNSVPWAALAGLPRASEELSMRMQRLEETVSERMTGRGGNLKEEEPQPESKYFQDTTRPQDEPQSHYQLQHQPQRNSIISMKPVGQFDNEHLQLVDEPQRNSIISMKPVGQVDNEHLQMVDGLPPADDAASEEDETGAPRPHGVPTIPINHTTNASLLLAQAGIEPLVRGAIGRGHWVKNTNYPNVQERKRGVLRIYGRGEGSDPTPGYDNESVQDHYSDGTPGNTRSEDSSPAQERDNQGMASPSDYTHNHPAQQPSLEDDFVEREIDFSRDTVFRLVESYEANINNMHPILTSKQLRDMVHIFLKNLPEAQTKSRPSNSNPHAKFIGTVSNRNPESPSSKRRRSPGGDYHEISHVRESRKPGRPEKNILSAIVLCVLALGKVCLHKDKIPDVAYLFSQEGEGAPSPVARNGHPQSPIQNSPASRRPSADGARLKVDRVKWRNVDLIPGLDYFGLATEIIGNQLGGSNLQHVHVNILAGLYHGQLGRVLESHAYIFHACCTLQKIIGGKLPYFKRVKVEGKMVSGKENPYIFAFWTCLQLESDIIAELPVQQSGILSLEEDMPPINLKVATEVSGFPMHLLESYTAQLYLRRHLNTVHGILYSPKDVKSDDAKNSKSKDEKDPTYLATIEALQDMIDIENGWAPNMKWNGETGERAKDILNARLRAKWYGAHVITFRPFILQILDFTAKTSHSGSDHSMALVPWSYVHAIDAPAISPNATSPADISPKMIDWARKGLLALIHSTSAFHDVVDPGSERLIVTNIWGTAHAQWGNLVTLLAAFNDPILKPELLDLVSTNELRLLLEKTIAFLKFNATTASALYSDARILIHMGRKLNLLPESAKTTPHGGLDSSSSSFKSVASVDGREVTMSGVYQN